MSSGTSGRPGRKAYLLISLFALALVLFPFLFWYYTWFGRKLSDSEIDQYFADTSQSPYPQHAPFHDALLGLLHDSQPMVRRNAALGLAVFGDSAARPELTAMLRPFTIHAPTAGSLRYRLKLGDYVNPGTLIARIGGFEVRSPVP